jgi:hypothetical protein
VISTRATGEVSDEASVDIGGAAIRPSLPDPPVLNNTNSNVETTRTTRKAGRAHDTVLRIEDRGVSVITSFGARFRNFGLSCYQGQ